MRNPPSTVEEACGRQWVADVAAEALSGTNLSWRLASLLSDRELKKVLLELGDRMPSTITPDTIAFLRSAPALSVDALIAGRPLVHRELTVPRVDGSPGIILSIFSRADHVRGGPGIHHIHGGGMVTGSPLSGISTVLNRVDVPDAVTISVEYRLAPEHPDPAPLDDCYAGLEWTAAHAADLGFDPSQLVVAGASASAGGGLAAGVALMARNSSGPALAAQF